MKIIELREGVVGYLYKQMDCHGEWATIFKVDMPYITWHEIRDIVPVYTAPPKREPLSDEEVFDIGYKSGFAVDRDESADYESDAYGFINEDGYVDNELYFKLVRAVEKAHGIGVDDE